MNLPEQVFLVNPPENTVLLSGNRYQVISPNCLDDIEDFTKVCRTCATVTDNNVPIFQGEGLRRNLAETIGQYLPIKVSHDDDLPQVLCVQCANTLLAFKDLSACCLLADVALRTRSSKGFLEESKPSVDCDSVSLKPIDEPAADFPLQMVGKVLVDYVAMYLDSKGGHTLVCQACGVSCRDVGSLARHVGVRHKHLRTEVAVVGYIEECVTFEEALSSAASSQEEDQVESSDSEGKVIQKEYPCSKCPNSYTTAERLVSHAIEHGIARDSQKCVVCDKQAVSRLQLVRHVRREHARQALQSACRSCAYVASDSAALAEHVQRTHLPKAPPQASAARAPNPNHKKYRRATCPICLRTLHNEYRLQAHLRLHEAGAALDTFPCASCGRLFRSRQAATEHQRRDHSLAPHYVCAECGERFRTAAARRRHAARHRPPRHVCALCDRAFHERDALREHSRMHFDQRPHACRCGRAFRKRCHLRAHQASCRPVAAPAPATPATIGG